MTNALSNWRLSLKSDGIPIIFDKLWVAKFLHAVAMVFSAKLKKINAWVMKDGERGTNRQTQKMKERKKERRDTHTLTKWVIQTREIDAEKYEREEIEKRDSPKLFICYLYCER